MTGRVAAAALRRIGFRQVFDTDFAADLTIMEEGTEQVRRIRAGERLPLFTSCCPAWVKYAETYYPELLPHVSTCKSPQEMLGATVKSWLAHRQGIDPREIFVVSVMPCTAKKFEAQRPELSSAGVPDVDALITTRQLSRMMRICGIDFASLPEEELDRPFGAPTGSGDGSLRGPGASDRGRPAAVQRAAGRRTGEGGGRPVGLRGGDGMPGRVRRGGGQLFGYDPDSVESRMRALYALERSRVVRLSYRNPAIADVYREFFGEPGFRRAHELLHTRYATRSARR